MAAELSGIPAATLRAWERRYGVPIPRRTASALLACVDAEQHVLGPLGAARRFAASGARTVVLGAMTPASALAEAVRSMAPRLVGLSMSVAAPPAGARALYRAYGKACGTTPWVVGGAGVEACRAAIESAGGTVAVGPSSAWNAQIREWSRIAR
jgi:hypothetical protein